MKNIKEIAGSKLPIDIKAEEFRQELKALLIKYNASIWCLKLEEDGPPFMTLDLEEKEYIVCQSDTFRYNDL